MRDGDLLVSIRNASLSHKTKELIVKVDVLLLEVFWKSQAASLKVGKAVCQKFGVGNGKSSLHESENENKRE